MIATVIAITIATANQSPATITDGVTTGLPPIVRPSRNHNPAVVSLPGPNRRGPDWTV
jgi:hypothetical protein